MLLQEIQRHPYKDLLLHLDFRELDENKNVRVRVPLIPKGIAPGVKMGGQLQMIVRDIAVAC